MIKALARLLPILAMLGLAACGFHPRGAVPQITGLPGPLYIAGIDQYSSLHAELVRQLRSAGIQVTDDPTAAGSSLQIGNHHRGQRLFGVDAQNRANEYELEESLSFRLRSDKGKQLLGQQTVRVIRTLYLPINQILAGDNQERLLRQEMQQALVDKVIRRLEARD